LRQPMEGEGTVNVPMPVTSGVYVISVTPKDARPVSFTVIVK